MWIYYLFGGLLFYFVFGRLFFFGFFLLGRWLLLHFLNFLDFLLGGFLGDEDTFLEGDLGWLYDAFLFLESGLIIEDQLEIAFGLLRKTPFLSAGQSLRRTHEIILRNF
jgi:hypothetical protein